MTSTPELVAQLKVLADREDVPPAVSHVMLEAAERLEHSHQLLLAFQKIIRAIRKMIK